MDASLDRQLDVIREATQAMQQTLGQPRTTTIMIDGETEVYETTQSMLILPKGLQVSGSGESLKIEFLTGQNLQQIPQLTGSQVELLQELGKDTLMGFGTLFAVVFVVAFLYDLLFKKLLR